ncbi:SGNH/GDSL hydrolase family protein [Allosphingosinicella sp.]|jgi:lysophospholipase L1-like esterase|uniref:SGNH/GDSL hydrolase family protein n=1 Tax=Allosphingosinicella sp. TaxID=2823234 RepID=UPI002EFAB5C3
MGHLVLLGDSIFDNAAYVQGGPDVVAQLREALPRGWRASLLAVDGAVTRGVPDQLRRIPTDTTLLVVSVGGNDALGAAHVLSHPAGSVAEAVGLLASVQERFAADYRTMVEALADAGLPAALCTIYDTRIEEPDGRVIRSALSLFNDEITRCAFSRGMPLIDLRLICAEDEDYANPIEPSVLGGAKIAAAIARLASSSPQDWRRPLVVAVG